MRRGWIIAIGGAITVLLVFVVVVMAVDASRSDEIAEGIRIGKVDVGGMSTDEASDRVRAELVQDVGRPVRLAYGPQRFVLRPKGTSIAIRVDVDATVAAARDRGREGNAFSRVFGGGEVKATVPARVTYSREALDEFVARVAERVDRQARDADIDVRDGKLARTRARSGVTVKRDELRAALARRLTGEARGTGTVKIAVTVSERPDRTLADLQKRYPRVIGIDRDAKILRLYRNLRLEHKYEIAVGKQGFESSAGRYEIEDKQVDPAWHAPNKPWAGALAGQTIPAGDPRNPLEARFMAYHDGEGIHGTKDLASLGTTASHGCIRMAPKDVRELYDEVKVGTPVFMQ